MSETQTRDDVINLNVNVEDWISSQEADVTLTVNMAVEDDMDTKAVIEAAFDEILKGNDWKVIDLNQFQDSTKMTKLNAVVYARLDEQLLSNLQDNIKEVVKPGLQIRVSNISFTPTLAEMEDFNHKLRGEVYKKINEEIVMLNEIQSQDQGWRVGQVAFSGGGQALHPFEIAHHYSGNNNIRSAQPMMAMAVNTSAEAFEDDDVGGGTGGMGTGFGGETAIGGSEGFAIAKKVQMSATVRLHSLVR